ncbi:hypothetical protein EMIHUDRAFT_445582 [Emiliania huxleyi CCMP1516]|uniref:GH18 domain-containing protein n=2 Tax=Emiliania huxleyi TaxID=2903 RepID=A0A0D3IW26_EMIH1|nr:hypothetical protein EMIHUDRAFT_445589 [Emiliania huxleyi CCMP1516]XP_005767901.1 hypothetical protein EMIHUDRAFT_445582 [Emiliania huxleyi CCMP1516]EOD15461.1 hypothetical protein EMIHUDRAFT_445589 [Emiliania huxleyi CCMP1516]EOD15472.1 hypothetical protein EMIHUDRAFT_445582 [Emiliania huxleyi CCMP1516]|eukprot:XP_005767890.1 hypothetical protein EMIHUDRAFT_445589 [Emiliania huxleyi CCMP1516]
MSLRMLIPLLTFGALASAAPVERALADDSCTAKWPDSYCTGDDTCHGHPKTKCGGASPAPTPPSDPAGTLFLLFEALGEGISDWHALPDSSAFGKVGINVPNFLKGSYSIELWSQVESQVSTPTERWLNIYFGKDALPALAQCNFAANDTAHKACSAALADYIDAEYAGADLTGISFDDEVGDPRFIVAAMESYAADHGLLLGWSQTLKAMERESPRGLGSTKWDYSWGQAYTDDTTLLYAAKGCAASGDFWDLVAKSHPVANHWWSEHMVPMVCGGGNCQEPPASYRAGDECVDERLSPAALDALFAARAGFANAAVWYGAVAAETGGIDGNTCYLSAAKGDWKKGCVEDGIAYKKKA